MVSGSQLQVAKLAQMCPAAPSSAEWRLAVASSAQRHPAATWVKLPGQAPGSSSRVKLPDQAPGSSSRVKLPGQAPRSSSRVKTRMEHLGAPWSTKCPFKTNSPSFYVRLKKRRVKAPDPDPGSRPESRGPQGALGSLILVLTFPL